MSVPARAKPSVACTLNSNIIIPFLLFIRTVLYEKVPVSEKKMRDISYGATQTFPLTPEKSTGLVPSVSVLLEIVHLLGQLDITTSIPVGMLVLDGTIQATALVPLILIGFPPDATVSLEVVQPVGHTLATTSIQALIGVRVGALQRYPVIPLKVRDVEAPTFMLLLALNHVPEHVFMMSSVTPR